MIRCTLMRNLITAAVLAGEDPGWPIASHAAHCIKCQAHVASLRATRRRLSELGSERVNPPPGFETLVMDRLDDVSRPPPSPGRWRSVVWGRAAGASMAAAVVAAVWMRRRAIARA